MEPRPSKWILALLAGPAWILMGLTAVPATACDSSGCLLVTRGQNGILSKGAWRVDVSFRWTSQTLPLEGSRQVTRVLRPKVDFENRRLTPGYHDETGGREQFLQVEGAYGLTSRATLLLSFPLYARRSYEIAHPPQFRETYTTEGNGDVLLGVRYGLGWPARGLVAGLSLKAPSGPYRLVSPNPGDVGILDPTLQPGSGSADVLASLQHSRRAAGIDWTVSGSYQVNTANDLGYRFGNEAVGSLAASRKLAGRLNVSVQVKAFHKGRSRFLGQGVPSTGTTVVYATPSVRVTAVRDVSLYGYVQVPVYRYVNEAQLAPRVGLLLGVSRTF